MAQPPAPAHPGPSRSDLAAERTVPGGSAGASPTVAGQGGAGQGFGGQPGPASPAGMLTELKVSGHVMMLDTGLYCIVHKPALGAVAAQAPGLPGIRVSLPPAAAGRPGEAVEIAALRPDGWLALGGDAALVRVNAGPAPVLVTIYQAMGAAERTAPNIQVMKLLEGAPAAAARLIPTSGPAPIPASGPVPGPVPGPAPGSAPGREAASAAEPGASAAQAEAARAAAATRGPAVMEMIAHIQERGDVGAMLGEWLGERGSKRWIEGFGLSPTHEIAPRDIEYQAVLGQGWLSPWVEGGQFCGSRAMALPLLGLRVRLRGDAHETHDVAYSASFIDGSLVGPVANGEACEADSLAAMEAFQVTVRPRHAGADAGAGPEAAIAEPASTRRGRTKSAASDSPAAPPVAEPARPKPSGRKR